MDWREVSGLGRGGSVELKRSIGVCGGILHLTGFRLVGRRPPYLALRIIMMRSVICEYSLKGAPLHYVK